MKIHACILLTLGCILFLTGCGGGSGGDGTDSGGPTTPTIDHNTKNFQVEPSSAAGVTPSLDAHRAGDGTVSFSGKFGVQRISSAQTLDNAPPAKLSVRYVNDSTGFVYVIGTISRGSFATGDTLDGSSDHNGVWYYTDLANLGYSLPSGTVIRAEIIDNGDTTAASGDELQSNGFSFFINTPLTAASNSSPIPFHTFTVPGAG